jgi:hypothetical protein
MQLILTDHRAVETLTEHITSQQELKLTGYILYVNLDFISQRSRIIKTIPCFTGADTDEINAYSVNIPGIECTRNEKNYSFNVEDNELLQRLATGLTYEGLQVRGTVNYISLTEKNMKTH